MPKGPLQTPKGTRSHDVRNPNYPFKRSAQTHAGHHPRIPTTSRSRDILASADRLSEKISERRVSIKVLSHKLKQTRKALAELRKKYPGVTSIEKRLRHLDAKAMLELPYWKLTEPERLKVRARYNSLYNRESNLTLELQKIRHALKMKNLKLHLK